MAASPQIPLSVQRLLEDSVTAQSRLVNDTTFKNPLTTKTLAPPTAHVAMRATRLQSPSPVPDIATLIKDDPLAADDAMRELVDARGYRCSDTESSLAVEEKSNARRIVEEGLREFFYGADLPQASFKMSPVAHANEILRENSAYYNSLEDPNVISSTLRGPKAAGPASPATPAGASGSAAPPAARTRAHNTVAGSVDVFAKILAAPVTKEMSLYSVAMRAQLASDFLLGDVVDALSPQSREIARALAQVRACFRASYSDLCATVFLVAAEGARLRQELAEARLAVETQKQRAATLLTALDERRRAEQRQAQESLRRIEEQRRGDVERVLARSVEHGEQVRTLRALVEAIKADQSVRETEILKRALADERAQGSALAAQNAELSRALQDTQAEYASFRADNAEAAATISSLRTEVKHLEGLRAYCKGCTTKVVEAGRLLAADVTKRMQRIARITEAVASLEEHGELAKLRDQKEAPDEVLRQKERTRLSLFEDLRARLQQPRAPGTPGAPDTSGASGVYVDTADKDMLGIDTVELLREMARVEDRLAVAPRLQDMDGEIQALRGEIQRLKKTEAEFEDLRRVYRGMLVRSQAAQGAQAAGGAAGAGTSEALRAGGAVRSIPDSHLASAAHQTINENTVTLLREQPLSLLVAKTFSVHIVESSHMHGAPSDMHVTAGHVSAVIALFLRHLCMTAFTSDATLHKQLAADTLPLAAGTPSSLLSAPIQALFSGWVRAQFHVAPEERRTYLSELLLCKVVRVLSTFQDAAPDVYLEDDSMTLGLGALLLNTSLSSDELIFLVYLAVLAHGGLPDAPPVLLPFLDFDPHVPTRYITLERALGIVQITVSRTIMKGFIETFIAQGRATGLVRDVTRSEIQAAGLCVSDVWRRPSDNDLLDDDVKRIFASTGNVARSAASPATQGAADQRPGSSADQGDLPSDTPTERVGGNAEPDLTVVADKAQPPSGRGTPSALRQLEQQHVSIINVNFFLMSLIKAYRTEVMTRLEAARVMYAGSLLECSSLLKTNKLAAIPDPMRFRVVREIIRTINPICDDCTIDAAYLDIVWRSPSANWSILVDACRTRGVFSTAVKFPPIEAVMELVGGYDKEGVDNTRTDGGEEPPRDGAYSDDVLLSRARLLIGKAKLVLLHLASAMGSECAVATRAIIQEITNIDRAFLALDNVSIVLNALKASLMYAIELAFSVVNASGRDFGIESYVVRRSLAEGRGIQLRKVERGPTEVYMDAMFYLVGTLCATLGWEVDVTSCITSYNTPKAVSKRRK